MKNRKFKKPNHIFIEAQEAVSASSEEVPMVFRPALYCVEAPILETFVKFQLSVDPPEKIKREMFSEGPIIWDTTSKRFTFHAWFWSIESRQFLPVRFCAIKSAERFADDSETFSLAGTSDSSPDFVRVRSIPLSISAYEHVASHVLRKEEFVMATGAGISTFKEFDVFERRFLEYLEDRGLSDDSLPNDVKAVLKRHGVWLIPSCNPAPADCLRLTFGNREVHHYATFKDHETQQLDAYIANMKSQGGQIIAERGQWTK